MGGGGTGVITVRIGVGPGVGSAGVTGAPRKPVGVIVGMFGGFVESLPPVFSVGRKIRTNAPKMSSVVVARFIAQIALQVFV